MPSSRMLQAQSINKIYLNFRQWRSVGFCRPGPIENLPPLPDYVIFYFNFVTALPLLSNNFRVLDFPTQKSRVFFCTNYIMIFRTLLKYRYNLLTLGKLSTLYYDVTNFQTDIKVP